MRLAPLAIALLPAALACGHDDEHSCFGPAGAVEHVRHVKRIQPGAPEASYWPKAPLEWGQLNFLHTTDTHGWLEGHLKEENYGADWGDFVSFSRHMKHSARKMGVDLLLVDTGDLHDGTGLSDATTPDGAKSMTIFDKIDYDLLTIGNHELYVTEVAQQMFTQYAKLWGDRYITSNVKAYNKTTGTYEYVGATHRYFTTAMGLRVMAFGVLFDFTGNTNASQVIPAADMVQESWFKSAVNTTDPVDVFVLFGHNPVRPTDETSTLQTVWDALRQARPTTPIQIFGGHTHIRDFAVYDHSSIGIESGRYCETLGWMSMAGFDQGNSGFKGPALPKGVKTPSRKAVTSNHTVTGPDSPFVYSRRYLDWNRNTFAYHSRIPLAAINTTAGEAVTNNITDIRQDLKLGELQGCVPETYCISCVPFDNATNIFPGAISPAFAASVVNDTRADKPRIILANTGMVRFDIHKGPFTKDDEYIVSPFEDVFMYIPDVPYAKAKTVLDQLNKGSVAKRNLASMPIPRDICTDPLMQGHLARRQDDAPFSRRQETVTSGYVTTDDWGSDGDDSVHNALPHYEIPAYFETRVKFPNETNPDTVDLVFLDFIQEYILEDLGGDYTDDMVECYVDCEFSTRDIMPPYAKKAWQDNIDDCPLDS